MSYRTLEDALLYGVGVERPYVCTAHNDHNASASVNSITGLFCCYVCGHAGKVNQQSLTFDAEGVARFATKVIETLTAENRHTESWLDLFDAAGPGAYWRSRFNTRTCRHYRLGSMPNAATYPLRDNRGDVLGIVSRDTTGLRRNKYGYPDGVDVSHLLLDYHRMVSDTVVLVEGMADAAAVTETGYLCAMAVYGSSLSKHQVALLQKYAPRRILVAFDQDFAGQKGAEKADWQLGRHFPVDRLTWDTYKDLAEMPLSDRTAMLDHVLADDVAKDRVERLVVVR